MPGLAFLGHADAAVQLDRLLPDEARALVDLHLGGGDRAAALGGVGLAAHHRCIEGHAARLLDGDQHVHRTVLQRLEAADRDAELLAHLQVLDGDLVHPLHRADRFGAQRGRGGVDGVFDQRQRGALGAEQGVGTHAHRLEADVGGALVVLRADSRGA